MVRAIGAFDFAIELRGFTLDVSVADTLIFDMPVELGLELMAVFGSDFFDVERELFDDVIDKVEGVCLCVLITDFESPNMRRINNSGSDHSTR